MPCDNLPGEGDPAICAVGGSGLLLPLGGDAEQGWGKELRAVLYLVGLCWCFMGVAIIAEIFMAAIEKVTSKKVLTWDKTLKKYRTRTIWNPTVANLTLMALGSSAPEILLNVIGIFPTFQSSSLGPSTIVGSASFNLLVITAVCVISIPNGEIRKIKDLGVFACTAFFSVFAYIWLLFILMVTSPDVVDVAEGVITFVFFWVLVVLAFLFDKGYLNLPGMVKEEPGDVIHPESSPEELADMELKVRRKYGQHTNLTHEQVTALMHYEFFSPESRAKQRINATRSMFGGKKLTGKESLYDKGKRWSEALAHHHHTTSPSNKDGGKPEVTFKALNYTVLESVGDVEVKVQAIGVVKEKFSVSYASRDGTARAGDDYHAVSGTLEFGPSKTEHVIKVGIMRSEGHEATEEFYVDLKEPGKQDSYALGTYSTVTIVVIDEDLPGKLKFEEEQIRVPPAENKASIPVHVLRKNGCSGKVTVAYRTESDSATEGADFESAEGILEFDNGQTSAEFSVKIMPKNRFDSSECFRVYLSDATGGATFDDTTDGGSDRCICTVILEAADKGRAGELASMMKINWDNVAVGNDNYKGQFISAVYCNGSPEAQKDASAIDWAMHILAFPWKLLFACVPPTEYAGGWVCFFCALIMIGFVTVIIGDMAELLGCVVGISPATTAITLVALGTSLPDTFASRSAAMSDPYADNSIGNVTGSNSVNVFLGLGLPWMIAAIYWQFIASCEPGDTWYLAYGHLEAVISNYPEGIFVVPAGSLSISVIAFSGCALLCLGTLVARRVVFGGELGGAQAPKWATAVFFVLLWIVYIVVSILLGD
eukprot:TRINITY_DN91105_c0_g1_i1.p1 TRINITY_DN91105_c0_g1~~TRINITY_DN91105_c0_g1_i1.p1  ORF type:complete len:824 (+),score=154.97 TRINITY_DN91105_c0_g1_i1:26-2497(+)